MTSKPTSSHHTCSPWPLGMNVVAVSSSIGVKSGGSVRWQPGFDLFRISGNKIVDTVACKLLIAGVRAATEALLRVAAIR